MTERKTKSVGSGLPGPDVVNKKRKILADLHSGMVLLARFARSPEDGEEEQSTGSKRSRDVRRVLKVPTPASKHRWN